MKLVVWLIVNSLIAACFWFGFVEGVKGALNVSMFLIWLGFVISAFSMMKEVIDYTKAGGGIQLAVPLWFNNLVDLALLVILVWTGHLFLGCIWILKVFFSSVFVMAVNETNT